MNFFAAFFFGVLEGEPSDAGRRFFGDDLEAFYDSRYDLMLQAGVQVFGVLADDDQIDVLEAGPEAREILHRTKIGVKIQSLTKSHVDAPRSASDGRGHRTFEAYAIAAHGLDSFFIEYAAGIGGAGCCASVNLFPVDLDAGRFQDAAGGAGNLGADSFAGQKRDFVSHSCI